MRLITLVIALALVGGLVVYNKNTLLPGNKNSHQTVKEQSRQILDSTKSAVGKYQKQLKQQQKTLGQDNQ
ncbi:MAG: hypothetical protein P8Z75_06435 [Gammaproteobacteria bacterium]|jgi:hypothetical protein